jgi:CDGSH-type Zn-finger protein/ferredoxin|nr:CDGSH iron-sulfur domain-containing protein [Candidatus Krumholzibacteria bacterium]
MAIKIDLIPNGPIRVTAEGEDFPVLRREGLQDLTQEGPAFLCRCGESASKPFCDGTHAKVGYSDENRCANDMLQDFHAPEITVHFNRSICSGAGQCVRGLPEVFISGVEDWIQPGEAPVEDVIATVRKCPSGALTFTRNGKSGIQGKKDVVFNIVKDGPYEITGPVQFDPPRWSQNASRTMFALCRCGKSSNAPFCDYSHGEQGWQDGE